MAGSHLLHINLQTKPWFSAQKRLDTTNMVVYEREGYVIPNSAMFHMHTLLFAPLITKIRCSCVKGKLFTESLHSSALMLRQLLY